MLALISLVFHRATVDWKKCSLIRNVEMYLEIIIADQVSCVSGSDEVISFNAVNLDCGRSCKHWIIAVVSDIIMEIVG